MLEQKLNELEQSDIYPFHMPGHKRAFLPLPIPMPLILRKLKDLIIFTMQPEFCRRRSRKRQICMVQKNVLSGKRKYLRTSCGDQCSSPTGRKILMARNCHKAVYHAMYLRQLVPVYLYPEDTAYGIQGQVTPQMVRKQLNRHRYPAVVITSRHTTGSYRISKTLRIPCMHMGFR